MNLIGQIHLITSCLALVSGTYILVAEKGSEKHKRMGYVYVANMAILLITAFMIYRLFNGFGIFHVAAIVSTITLISGMLPAIRRNKENWIVTHFAWMYWSVMGLYAAFASEVITRLLPSQFFPMVGLATGIIMTIGAMAWKKKKKVWETQFQKFKKI